MIFQKKEAIPLLIIALVIFYCPVTLFAQSDEGYAPTESGISLNSGYTYDPSDDINFLQVSLFRLYDYDRIWKHKAPDNLRFKVEGSVGGAVFNDNDVRVMANIGILALIYLNKFETDRIKPYIEAGIGGIYTDYRVKGQDYRFNFNPQAGIGIEFKREENQNWFMSFRVHHISNGGIGSSNRGMNSVVFALGQYF